MTWLPRLQTVLESWKDTPYLDGQQCKGVGVDCVRFVTAVIDEMYRFKREPIQKLPRDISFHNHETSVGAVKALMRIYSPCEFTEQREPGNIVIAATASGTPGHALILGDENRFWHVSKRVCFTGGKLFHIYGIIRSLDKEKWN